MKKIYLDYASLTPIDRKVAKEIKKYSSADYGNPSALYTSAVKSKKAVQDARVRIAKVLHAHADEIYFTGSGTEANNLALNVSGEIVISAIEHSSIIEKKGVTVVGVNSNGVVNFEELEKAITAETRLVSVMYVNNEIGTVQPIAEIAKIVRDARKKFGTTILLHTDACQAGLFPLHVEKLGVDLMTLDGHKLYGPRGIGMLYIKRGVKLDPIIFGGGQEKGLRSGTENVPAIMGFALALEIADKIRDKEAKRISDLKSFFVGELKKGIPNLKINGVNEEIVEGRYDLSSPHIVNISFPNIDSEFFVLKLDAAGIECSTKSACLRDEDESYVLRAIGADSRTSVRFSFGRDTGKSDLKKVAKKSILEAWKTSQNNR
jgi:cysteine desulfurase